MFRKLIAVMLTMALFLSACATTRTDALNHTIKLKGPAKRVVSMAPSNTEILFAVGAGKQVVGRDMFSDYPAEAKSVQDIGGSNGQYNTEAIVALKPDLVLAGEINPPELVDSLQKLGLTVYYLKNPSTLEEMYANVQTVGSLTGHVSEATALVESLQTRGAAVDDKIKPLSSRPNVYYELDATDATKPYTAGPGTFVSLIIDRAGAKNIGDSLTSQWAQISLEQVVAANPSFIILGDSAYGVTSDSVKGRPGWDGIAAVQDDHIFPFDDNLVSRPGPRLVDGLEQLAKLIRPDLFK